MDCVTRSFEFITKYSAKPAESAAQTIPNEAKSFGNLTTIFLFATRSYMTPKICFGKSSTRCEATFAVAISRDRSSGSGVIVDKKPVFCNLGEGCCGFGYYTHCKIENPFWQVITGCAGEYKRYKPVPHTKDCKGNLT